MKTLAETIENEVATLAPHLVIVARAGTGKTTTLVEGLRAIQGESSEFIPSPQQAVIWQEMAKSDVNSSTCFVAFNKSIAKELEKRVPNGVEAMTLHSLGYRALKEVFPNAGMQKWKISNIVESMCGMTSFEIRKRKPGLIPAIQKLVDIAKMNLAKLDRDSLIALAVHYDIDSGGDSSLVLNMVPDVIEECKDVSKWGFDFCDMIWIPVVLELSVKTYDVLLVDEAQDLNRCQQELAIKSGTRLIFCGDDRQAIYGFCGADSKSLKTLESQLSETKVGCEVLPLTVTRRCGTAIVKEAQKLVPDFEAHESNCEGSILHLGFNGEKAYTQYVEEGDMILCRTNAPLISQCFLFLREGRKATIQGRDVAEGLITTVKKLLSDTSRAKDFCQELNPVVDLENALENWVMEESEKEACKKHPDEDKLIRVQDRHDCLMCFCENTRTVGEVINRVNSLFTDNKESLGIRLSSIHKAKGLEAKRVFIIQPKGASIPHPMAKSAHARDQEYNLLYVAQTRAIEELCYVN